MDLAEQTRRMAAKKKSAWPASALVMSIKSMGRIAQSAVMRIRTAKAIRAIVAADKNSAVLLQLS